MSYVSFNDALIMTNSRLIFKEVTTGLYLSSQSSSSVMLGLNVLRIPFQG